MAAEDTAGHRAGALALLLPPGLLAVLALPPLVRQPLWYDEVATRDASRRSVGQLWHLLHHTDAVFGGYYVLMHLLLTIGDATWWLRLPSLVAAMAAVTYAGRIARHLMGTRMGAVAAGILAVNPFVVAYAHDARPYALAMLGTTAAANQLLGPRTDERTVYRWAGWASFAIAAHLLAVVSLLPQLWLLRGTRRGLPAVLAPLALAGAIAGVGLTQRGQVGWLSKPPWYALLSGWATLSGGWGLAALAALGVAVAVRTRRHSWAAVATWAVAPVSLLLLVSRDVPLYLPRYLIEVTPALALLSALGIVAVRSAASRSAPPARTAAFAAMCVVASAVAVSTAIQAGKPYQYENLPAAADLIRDSAQRGDGLVYLGDTTRLGMGDAVTADPAGPGSDDGPVPSDLLLDPHSDPLAAGTLQATSLPPPMPARRWPAPAASGWRPGPAPARFRSQTRPASRLSRCSDAVGHQWPFTRSAA